MIRSNTELRARVMPAPIGSGRDGARYIDVGGGGTGGARSTATAQHAKITGHAGTESPYRYSGVEVVQSTEDPTVFTTVTDGVALGWDLINEAELGDAQTDLSPVPDDSIVSFRLDGGFYYFVAANQKGTYS